MTHTAKIVGGSVLIFIALATALTSGTMSVQYGLLTGVTAAVPFFLAEIGRFSIPAVAARFGWNRLFKAAIVLCGAASLYAAVNIWLDGDAKHLLSASTINAQSDRASAEYKQISAELASIKVTGTVADLDTLAKTFKKQADDELANGGQGKRYRAALDKYTATTADLAVARRKEELTAAQVAAKAELDHVQPVVASGLAQVLSAATGLNQEKIAVWIGAVKVLITIGLLESLVYLGIPGFTLLIAGLRKEELPEVKTSNVVSFKPLDKREDEVFQKLLSMILRSEDGTIICSARELARRLGVSNSTFSVWLGRWTKEGKIKVEPVTAHKKRYAIA